MKFCDLICKYATNALSNNMDGNCMTFQAIYCKKKNYHILKNSPCYEKEIRDE